MDLVQVSKSRSSKTSLDVNIPPPWFHVSLIHCSIVLSPVCLLAYIVRFLLLYLLFVTRFSMWSQTFGPQC